MAGTRYTPMRLWYLGVKQQMASPLVPLIWPPWSVSFPPPCSSSCFLPFVAAAFVAAVTDRARRRSLLHHV